MWPFQQTNAVSFNWGRCMRSNYEKKENNRIMTIKKHKKRPPSQLLLIQIKHFVSLIRTRTVTKFMTTFLSELCVSWFCDICLYGAQQTFNIKIGPLWWEAAGADGSLGASLLRHLCSPQVVLHTDKLWDLLLFLSLSDLLLLILKQTNKQTDKSVYIYNIMLSGFCTKSGKFGKCFNKLWLMVRNGLEFKYTSGKFLIF